MGILIQDLRCGLRMLAKNPGFTVVTALVLALGIGANTAVFTVLDAVLLRPLPYKNADRLTVIWQSDSAHRTTGEVFDTYREFDEWHKTSCLESQRSSDSEAEVLEWPRQFRKSV